MMNADGGKEIRAGGYPPQPPSRSNSFARSSAALTNGAVTAYVYDPENRLKKLTESDGSVTTSLYAGDGLRRTKITKAGRFTYVWDGGDYLGEYS